MSTIGSNYGGRVDSQQGNIKQFVTSSSSNFASWIYKKLSNGLNVQSPPNAKMPVLIPGDLIVNGSIFNPSDIRVKTNVNNITNEDADKLFTLNPIIYNYKNDATRKKHYGVSAQELEKMFPELVEDNNISGNKTVNYQEFIPIIVAKIRAMQIEIDEIKNCATEK